MANEKAVFDALNFETEDMNLDDLEQSLQAELDIQFEELDLLEQEREHINNPDHLGETVMNTILEQFVNQIAVTAGEDFLRENRELLGINVAKKDDSCSIKEWLEKKEKRVEGGLDLSNAAHIQTAENFAEGKIATHNYKSKKKLEQNYDRYKNTSHKEFRKEYVDPGMNEKLKRAGELKKQGIDTVKDIYTGKQIPTETKLENGKNNPKAAQREHVKASAELYKNPSLQMANSNEELADIINDPNNLQGYTTAERNNRKSDKSAEEMEAQDKNKHWEKADKKAEEFVKKKEQEGEERLKKEGRKTQKEEAFRIGGKALRTALMSLLAALVKEIICKLVLWLKSTEKSLNTLIEHMKMAIHSFVGNLKNLLISTTDSILTTIATSIIGPVVSVIKKTVTLLKQGWKSLKEAIEFLMSPENRGKPLSYLLPQVGIIVVTGLSGIGAIVLGEVIEESLMKISFLKTSIPILGSPANLIGTLMGAIISGVIGAIVINLINKFIADQQKNSNVSSQLKKKNEILKTQDKILDVKIQKMCNEKEKAAHKMVERRKEASEAVSEALSTIFYEDEEDDLSDRLSRMQDDLEELLN